MIPLEPFLHPKDYGFIERVVMDHYDHTRYFNGSVEDYDRYEKAKRCGHFSIKRDSTTAPNFLCLDCGSLLSAESVFEAATS